MVPDALLAVAARLTLAGAKYRLLFDGAVTVTVG